MTIVKLAVFSAKGYDKAFLSSVHSERTKAAQEKQAAKEAEEKAALAEAQARRHKPSRSRTSLAGGQIAHGGHTNGTAAAAAAAVEAEIAVDGATMTPEEEEKLKATLASMSSQFKPPQVELVFHEFALNIETVPLATGATAVCVFVNDALSEEVLEALYEIGVRAILLRCAGYNNIDLDTAERLGLFVANVPSYSPQAVAEFSVALLQTLNRQTHRAYNRVREGNFSLDGLLGRTLHGKTVGVIGTGRIGIAAARILKGYGCRLLAYDPFENSDFTDPAEGIGGEYTDLDTLLPQCDFVSLHCPLMDGTRHIINDESLSKIKPGALLVNTSRGGLIDTRAVITALKDRRLGGLALDVYESEGTLFYNDHSGDIIEDDELMRLMTFPNVIVCGHQAFFTEEALAEIASSTLRNLEDYLHSRPCKNSLVQSHKLYARRDSFPVRI